MAGGGCHGLRLRQRRRLLGGDHRVGLQVHQRAFGGGVGLGALLAQGDVVLHGVVAGRGVDALLAQGDWAIVSISSSLTYIG
ncbi:hypothetical protein D3C83_174300 [compost metagenome]